MRYTKHQLLALILGAGMAATLPAQNARRANGKQLDSTRVAAALARRAEGNAPAAQILSQRETLGLTDDQVARLEALRTSFATKEPAAPDIAKFRAELTLASRGEANIPAARAALSKINAAQDEVVIARLEAHNLARAVLNADQQVTFDSAEARRSADRMRGAFGRGMDGGRGGAGAPDSRGPGGFARGRSTPVTIPPL